MHLSLDKIAKLVQFKDSVINVIHKSRLNQQENQYQSGFSDNTTVAQIITPLVPYCKKVGK